MPILTLDQTCASPHFPLDAGTSSVGDHAGLPKDGTREKRGISGNDATLVGSATGYRAVRVAPSALAGMALLVLSQGFVSGCGDDAVTDESPAFTTYVSDDPEAASRGHFSFDGMSRSGSAEDSDGNQEDSDGNDDPEVPDPVDDADTRVVAIETDGQFLVQYARDVQANVETLGVVPADSPTSAPVGTLDLSAAIREEMKIPDEVETGVPELLVHEGYAYVLRNFYDEAQDEYAPVGLWISIVDFRTPTAPRFVATMEMPMTISDGSPHVNRFFVTEAPVVKIGETVFFHQVEWDGRAAREMRSAASVEVISFADPEHPVHVESLERGFAIAHGHLLVFGDTVVSWNKQATADPIKVQYALERFTKGATAIEALPPVNVPGAVVAYDSASHVAVTVDHQLERSSLSEEACANHPRGFGMRNDECYLSGHQLAEVSLTPDGAVVQRSITFEDDAVLNAASATSDRLFIAIRRGGVDDTTDNLGWWSPWTPPGGAAPTYDARIFPLGSGVALAEAGRIQLADSNLRREPQRLDAHRVLVGRVESGVGILDAEVADAPTYHVDPTFERGCQDVTVLHEVAVCVSNGAVEVLQ